MNKFKLIEKNNLTNDVYELVFETEKKLEMKPWQFITFILENIWWRAYSILDIIDNKIVLIIKKRELENGWRWWSKYICERKIWDILNGVWPAGHFFLKENKLNKLFIWTGTGFVPLYNQILWNINNKIENKIKLIFWVREEKDLFYIEKLENIKKENPNFDFEIYLSKQETKEFKKWYVTDFLTKQNLEDYEEFYICWAPAMIDSTNELLEKNWKENIYFEKY